MNQSYPLEPVIVNIIRSHAVLYVARARCRTSPLGDRGERDATGRLYTAHRSRER